jgi:exodeoxyribonuclease V beta subunit
LHRYLKLRLPRYAYERHFGGVYYLFLRGMQPQSGARLGVVAERPSEAFIDALDRLIEAPGDEPS